MEVLAISATTIVSTTTQPPLRTVTQQGGMTAFFFFFLLLVGYLELPKVTKMRKSDVRSKEKNHYRIMSYSRGIPCTTTRPLKSLTPNFILNGSDKVLLAM